MKLEFLAHYHAEHGYSLRERLFGYVHELAKHSSLIPSISNTLSNNAFSKVFLLKLGINSARSSPNLSKQQFIKWFNNREQPTHNTTHKKIIYFHDTWTNYYHPDIGIAAVKLLEEAGFEVLLIEKRECCGRPMLSKGMIEPARKRALKNASLLAPYAKEGIPIVGTEPSCILTFRDEYLDLLPQDEDISVLAKNSYTLDEFLTNLHESG
ncbi:MAG: FAD-binding oxidoreductase, partial [Phycisphaerae bacterium]|nr:FAD-binding oxidoreductase [Phycisphaerae bacterium]NIP51097.1 FAD-binding oxidoreductase [Phycisphaerae bacterium]NIW97497.1 FAD-binding oxidoreductase [Phycisphaerae bacterium]NIX27023.1 FAD-binding oxidoreductase [Phycisphaerae bacterium]